MRLTNEEKIWIARRASGEYSTIPAVTMVVNAHKNNRNLDDQVFLEYARWAIKHDGPGSRLDKEKYLRLAVPVLEIIPEPYGTPWWKKPGAATVEVKPEKGRNTARKKKARDKPPAKKSSVRNLLDLFGND